MTRMHVVYKLFFSCSIFFDRFLIVVISDELMSPSNWRLRMVFLDHYGCYTTIRGVRDYSIERFHGFPEIRICGLLLSKYISFILLVNAAQLNIVDVVVVAPIIPVWVFLSFFLTVLDMSSVVVTTFCDIFIDGGCFPVPVTGLLFPDNQVGPRVGNGSLEMS